MANVSSRGQTLNKAVRLGMVAAMSPSGTGNVPCSNKIAIPVSCKISILIIKSKTFCQYLLLRDYVI